MKTYIVTWNNGGIPYERPPQSKILALRVYLERLLDNRSTEVQFYEFKEGIQKNITGELNRWLER